MSKGVDLKTSKGGLTFLKNKASNYGSVSGILEMEFWKWNFGIDGLFWPKLEGG